MHMILVMLSYDKKLGVAAELHEIPICLFLMPIKVPQKGSKTSYFSQLCICKFTEGTFHPIA